MDDHRTNQGVPRIDVTHPELATPQRRRWLGRLWVVPVLLMIVAVGWHYWPGAAPSGGRSEQAGRGRRFGGGAGAGAMTIPVTPASVQKGDVPITLTALGTVTPLATVTVKTQIAGQLTQVAFQEGQIVHAGDFLAQIDPRPYQLTLAQAQGTLLKDQALLKQAQLDLARYRKLAAQDSVAQQTVDSEVSLVQQYQGATKTDQAQIDTARLNLTYCHIIAPVSGRVGLRQVDVGNYVQTSDTNGIVVITQMQPMDVAFTLPEDNLPTVVGRLRAGTALPVTALDRTQTTRLATGTLKTLDNVIDTSTGTIKLKAEFDNRNEALFPNQFVNIQLLVDTLRDALVIPAAAIQRGAPGTFVYKINAAAHTVSVAVVALGPSDGHLVSITQGLALGDMVVVEGADKLRDGAEIQLPGDAPPKAGAAGSDGSKAATKDQPSPRGQTP